VPRIVVDTNVLVSSLFGGRPREVMELWRDGQFVLCLSDEIVAEYLEVLMRFGHPKREIEEFLALLSEEGERVVFVSPRERIGEVVADPEDNRFLECAVAAGAEMIVSGDRHLLGLKEFRGIQIVSPAGFLTWFAGR